MEFTTNQIRNVSIAGHGQTGKTTLFEQLLFTCSAITKPERVESGKTVSDYSIEETTQKISIYASLAHASWNNCKINVWDTPGSSDFIGEVILAFRSSETALMVLDGRSGVQIETIKLWRDLDSRSKPRMVYINRCEEERTDVAAIAKDVHDKFNVQVCHITIPMGKGTAFCGVIDVLEGKAYHIPESGKIEITSAIPAEYQAAYKEARGVLAGAAAEGDDDLLIKFIDEGELTHDEIVRGLQIAYANNRIVPVFCGNTLNNSGMVPILNFIALISPNPHYCIESAIDKDGKETTIKIDEKSAMSALIIKTMGDQFSGRLSFVKIITGSLLADSDLYNINEGRKEKVGKIFCCIGKKLEEVKKLSAGDIGIIAKLSFSKTSDTLANNAEILPFVRLRHLEPVYSMAVSAKEKRDEDKIAELLSRYCEEDRTITFKYNSETKQNVLSGMGELHLSILLKKVAAQSKIAVITAIPRVAYRETIQRKAQAEYTHKKQSGGHGQYGRVVLSIEPLARSHGYQFTNAVFGGAISKSYIPGVEKGIKEAMESGVLAGYPVVDVGSTIVDGKEHPVDSSEMAFKIAARNAFKDAMRQAGAILLEPICNITVWVESTYLGDIMSDLSTRRGRILGQSSLGGGIEEIRAQVPQSELGKYAIDLRSMTSGTGSFETIFDHYDSISGKIAEDLIKAAKECMSVIHTEE